MTTIPPQTPNSPVTPVATKGAKKGKKSAVTWQQFVQDANKVVGGAGASTATTGTTGATPGVTSTDAGDVITFSLPHQPAPFTPAPGTTTTDAAGGQQVTFQNWMESIRTLSSPAQSEELKSLQAQLKSTGFIKTTNYVPTGTLDSTTLTAWKNFGLSLVGAPQGVSASTVLAMGKNAPNTLDELQKIQAAINSARGKAAAITNNNVTLTDPNKVAQTFATAMESMGMGAPTQDQTNQFVNAFINGPQGEIAATQNQVTAEKQNYMSGVGNLQSAFNQINQGNLTQGEQTAQLNGPGGTIMGPTTIATKAQPNLDSEAIAAAQKANPDMYYATQSSYLYGIIQKMLSGNEQQATTPSSPTSSTPSGAILTTPIVGAP